MIDAARAALTIYKANAAKPIGDSMAIQFLIADLIRIYEKSVSGDASSMLNTALEQARTA